MRRKPDGADDPKIVGSHLKYLLSDADNFLGIHGDPHLICPSLQLFHDLGGSEPNSP